MKVIGLTGSIAMGKSTTAAMFRRLGIPVYDSDQAVRRLCGPGGRAVASIAAQFPGTLRHAEIDRARLGDLVFGDPAALRRLEAILHPMVRDERAKFLARCRAARRPAVLLDIPLLLESGGDRIIDYLIVVSCPEFLQTARLKRRKGMSEARIRAIRARQMPDREKRRHADRVIETGIGKRNVWRQVRAIQRNIEQGTL